MSSSSVSLLSVSDTQNVHLSDNVSVSNTNVLMDRLYKGGNPTSLVKFAQWKLKKVKFDTDTGILSLSGIKRGFRRHQLIGKTRTKLYKVDKWTEISSVPCFDTDKRFVFKFQNPFSATRLLSILIR